jgi:hypothetical protein
LRKEAISLEQCRRNSDMCVSLLSYTDEGLIEDNSYVSFRFPPYKSFFGHEVIAILENNKTKSYLFWQRRNTGRPRHRRWWGVLWTIGVLCDFLDPRTPILWSFVLSVMSAITGTLTYKQLGFPTASTIMVDGNLEKTHLSRR